MLATHELISLHVLTLARAYFLRVGASSSQPPRLRAGVVLRGNRAAWGSDLAGAIASVRARRNGSDFNGSAIDSGNSPLPGFKIASADVIELMC